MRQTINITVSLILTLSLSHLSNSTCCFGIRKVCETLSDVSEFGDEDWQSLVIIPGKCENNTQTPKREFIKRETFLKVPYLKNVYIVDLEVDFGEEHPFDAIKNNLVYLSIIRNNITVISTKIFQDLPRLKKLVLRDSEIITITKGAFASLPRLEVLLLSGNKFEKIETGILNEVEIKTLDLSYNAISTIEPNAFSTTLILLNLKKNQLIEIIDNTFANLHSLEMLILSKNKIKALRKGAFAGLSNLSKLDLSKNEIDTIESDTFSNLHELMFLYLKHNHLHILHSEIFLKDMINLTDLELEHNNLTNLEERIFKRMPNLEEITIGGNPWNCTNLKNIINLMNKRQIAISDTEDITKCNTL